MRGLYVLPALLSLVFTGSDLRAQEPSTAQCTCRPGAVRGAEDQYSAIDNGSLCVGVTTQGAHPVCRITVYCLSDGTGKGCPAYNKGNAAADAALFKPEEFQDLLKDFVSTLQEALQFGIDAYHTSLPVEPSQIGGDLMNPSNLDALRACMASFKNDSKSQKEAGETLNCAYTSSTHNLSIEFPVDGSKSQVSVQLVRRFKE
jgi:hypothetical protein